MTKTEAYNIFGLSLNQPVTLDLIKNRYRILTKTYHPDNPRTGSEEMMAKVNLAFDALRTYSFDKEDEFSSTKRQGTGFDKDFNPDFTPFEYGSRDESFYENNNYNRDYERKYDRYVNDYEEEEEGDTDYEEEEQSVRKKSSKRGGIFILFRMIGRLCKLIIILGIIGLIVAIPASIYFFGMNQRGILLAAAALIMSVLGILVFRFFSELIN